MRIVRAASLILLIAFAAPALAEGGFIESLGDVPLMPGLRLAAGRGMTFDTASGRIVEAVATIPPNTQITAAKIGDFYARALPQLGWTRSAAGLWRRDDEILRLEIEDAEVRFFLKPR